MIKIEKHIVKPGSRVKLSKVDASACPAFDGSKDDAAKHLEKIKGKIEELQELLYAEHKHKVLVVLQGMDTAGKDGVIKHVFDGMNPQGVKVSSFKVPTKFEADHDFLWRIHQRAPGDGQIMIFNRSHYESVLVERVHELVPKKVWKRRYEHINMFERMLADEGATILKFFLHIDKDEQRNRLQARIDDKAKHWKLSASDIPERKLWDKYQEAYEDALSFTSSEWAPWYVVPANRKWYRNLVICEAIRSALAGLDMKYPAPQVDVSTLKLD